jgi:hypothetical protein
MRQTIVALAVAAVAFLPTQAQEDLKEFQRLKELTRNHRGYAKYDRNDPAKRIIEVYLAGNSVDDSVLTQLGPVPTLESLILYNVTVTDADWRRWRGFRSSSTLIFHRRQSRLRA